MKRIFYLFTILFLLPGAKGPEYESPTGLMVEFIREPQNVKILDLKPEFSWIVPQKAMVQTSYQILVSSVRESLERNAADIWDSDRIISTESSEVEYNGPGLLPNTTYFWEVRIWNCRDKPGAYSEIQSFTTGNPEGYSTTPNRFIAKFIKPEKMIKISDNHFFIDFGKDAFGTLVIELNPANADSLTIHLGEKTSGVNKIDRNPGGTIRYTRSKLAVTPGISKYTLSLPPDPRNTGPAAVHLPDSFGVVTPFRYCEIENLPADLKPENVYQKTFTYYFDDEESGFTCSDNVLNQVWDISKYSMKATSFAGIYIDGDRERIPYEADAYINQLGHYYTDREYSMARVTDEYFMKHPTWPTEWILQTLLMFYNDFMFTGNKESLEENYDALKQKTLTSLAREDGLISSGKVNDDIMRSIGFANPKERIRDIIDWPPAQKDTGWKLVTPEGERDGYDLVAINTVVNAFHYRNLVLMSKIAGYLGREADSEKYMSLSARLKDSFNRILFNSTRGIYLDGEYSTHSSLHANMMALAFGLVPDEYKESVVTFIKSRGMACSVYGAQFLLEGLYRAGEADYALSLLTATNDRSWWNMINSGSTITMEAWDMKYKPNSDWNHAWGAAPANIIPGYLWGITPAEPGFRRAVICPQLSNLKQSKIKVPTIRGSIIAEFNNKGKSKVFKISIPGNMECEFIVPGSREVIVKLNGKKILSENGKLKLKQGLNKIEI
jgi:alpha-L-rhamnosidase